MKKIYISTTTFAQFSKEPLNILKSAGFKIDMNTFGRKLNKTESLKIYGEYDGIIAGTEIIDSEVINSSKKLKVISRVGVGVDNINIDYAKEKNIKVFKSETEPSLAVAELVLGIILNLIRKINLHDTEMKTGLWNKKMGSLISGKTLGIIGLGKIGKTLVTLTSGFSLNYLAFDKKIDNNFAASNDVEYCSLKNLIKNSDIISTHLSLNKKTNSLISNEELRLMKNDAILVNASRGKIINESALLYALSKGTIGGVGLDVYENEPYSGPLAKYENVILTPHIGSYAKEIRIAMELESVQNLIQCFN